jgi:hypothetical protein
MNTQQGTQAAAQSHQYCQPVQTYSGEIQVKFGQGLAIHPHIE